MQQQKSSTIWNTKQLTPRKDLSKYLFKNDKKVISKYEKIKSVTKQTHIWYVTNTVTFMSHILHLSGHPSSWWRAHMVYVMWMYTIQIHIIQIPTHDILRNVPTLVGCGIGTHLCIDALMQCHIDEHCKNCFRHGFMTPLCWCEFY